MDSSVRGEFENLVIQVNGVFIVTDFSNYIEKQLLANGVLDKQLNSRTISNCIATENGVLDKQGPR